MRCSRSSKTASAAARGVSAPSGDVRSEHQKTRHDTHLFLKESAMAQVMRTMRTPEEWVEYIRAKMPMGESVTAQYTKELLHVIVRIQDDARVTEMQFFTEQLRSAAAELTRVAKERIDQFQT